MTFDPSKPFNDLPPLPPAGEPETRRALKACVEARAALAELRGAGHLIPNQAMLINSIPTLEAQASSEIENIVTTADRLFRYASDGDANADPATKEALNYRKALYVGSDLLENASIDRDGRHHLQLGQRRRPGRPKNTGNYAHQPKDRRCHLHAARRGRTTSRHARELGEIPPITRRTLILSFAWLCPTISSKPSILSSTVTAEPAASLTFSF